MASTSCVCSYLWLILHVTFASNIREYSPHAAQKHYATPTRTELNVSLLRCVAMCSRSLQCISVSYQTTTLTCEINSVAPAYDSEDWIHEAGWEMYYLPECDLTIGGVATQTTTYCTPKVCGDAVLAIDGNIDGNFKAESCAHTQKFPPMQSWTVKLTSTVSVKAVLMYPRTDCCGERFHDIVIKVAETEAEISSGGTTCGTYPGPPVSNTDTPIIVTCSTAISGQYVKIIHEGNDKLALGEVIVRPY